MPSLPQLAGWAAGLVVVFLIAGASSLIRRRRKAVIRQLTGPEIEEIYARRPHYVDDMLAEQKEDPRGRDEYRGDRR